MQEVAAWHPNDAVLRYRNLLAAAPQYCGCSSIAVIELGLRTGFLTSPQAALPWHALSSLEPSLSPLSLGCCNFYVNPQKLTLMYCP